MKSCVGCGVDEFHEDDGMYSLHGGQIGLG